MWCCACEPGRGLPEQDEELVTLEMCVQQAPVQLHARQLGITRHWSRERRGATLCSKGPVGFLAVAAPLPLLVESLPVDHHSS